MTPVTPIVYVIHSLPNSKRNATTHELYTRFVRMDGEKGGISKHSEAQTVKANANARRESIGFRCPCLIASLGRASLVSLSCLSCRRLSFLCRLSCPSAARCLLTHQQLPPENGSEATVLTQASHSHHTLRNGTFR